MKILKYVLIAIGLLIVLFFVMGFINPVIEYECDVVADKSVKESWAVMSDEQKTSDWILGYKKTEPVSGTPGTVGAVSNIYIEEEGGQEMVIQETITALEEEKRIAMTYTMDFMNMDYEMQVEEKDGKTHIHTQTKAEGNGMISKSILSFMTGAMKEQEMKNLNNLKEAINNNTTDYFPQPDTTAVDSVMVDSLEVE